MSLLDAFEMGAPARCGVAPGMTRSHRNPDGDGDDSSVDRPHRLPRPHGCFDNSPRPSRRLPRRHSAHWESGVRGRPVRPRHRYVGTDSAYPVGRICTRRPGPRFYPDFPVIPTWGLGVVARLCFRG
jgi:hypothetical protein